MKKIIALALTVLIALSCLTACGKARGAVGAVLDGYTRDTPKVIEQNFPVFCSGTWAQDSSVRTYVFKWRCPIEIGQVTIYSPASRR